MVRTRRGGSKNSNSPSSSNKKPISTTHPIHSNDGIVEEGVHEQVKDVASPSTLDVDGTRRSPTKVHFAEEVQVRIFEPPPEEVEVEQIVGHEQPSHAATEQPSHAATGSGMEVNKGKAVVQSSELHDGNTYASKLQQDSKHQVNFRRLESSEKLEGVDVVLPKDSVRIVQNRFTNTLVGYFIGKRQAYPVVANFVKNNWTKFGLQRIMMNSNGFFFFKFASENGMQNVLENGPWLIRNVPIFLNMWSPTLMLTKEDIKSVAVWIKIHDVPITAYTDDGISMLATKLGTPKRLDSYTTDMCRESWGRSSYARAFVEISAETEFKDVLLMAIPNLEGEGYVKQSMKVEYEWKPPRCATCRVFGHDGDDCPKQVKQVQVVKPVQQQQGNKGVVYDGFQEVKKKKQKQHLVYRPISKPSNTSSSTGASTSKVNTSNQYELLNEYGDNFDTVSHKVSDHPKRQLENDDFDADVDEEIEILDNT